MSRQGRSGDAARRRRRRWRRAPRGGGSRGRWRASLLGRLLAVEHVEEVGGVVEVVARRDRLEALADAMVRRDDAWGTAPSGAPTCGCWRPCDMSSVSGSKADRAETAVRRTSMGWAFLTLRMTSMTPGAAARAGAQTLVEGVELVLVGGARREAGGRWPLRSWTALPGRESSSRDRGGCPISPSMKLDSVVSRMTPFNPRAIVSVI